jgi:hypothetical protein
MWWSSPGQLPSPGPRRIVRFDFPFFVDGQVYLVEVIAPGFGGRVAEPELARLWMAMGISLTSAASLGCDGRRACFPQPKGGAPSRNMETSMKRKFLFLTVALAGLTTILSGGVASAEVISYPPSQWYPYGAWINNCPASCSQRWQCNLSETSMYSAYCRLDCTPLNTVTTVAGCYNEQGKIYRACAAQAISPLDKDGTYCDCTLTCPDVCGDGQCNGDETCRTCPADCGECPPQCGDGQCNGDETCGTCPDDCGECSPRCGDGQCNGDEACDTCPDDCGECPGGGGGGGGGGCDDEERDLYGRCPAQDI